jgi:diaminohydroxyphosphoribosylaminopyrimidine deaminase/5-amino-6-(5-phosphoribosylamino)uracil reductase
MAYSPITPDWSKQGNYWFDLIREYSRDEIYCALVMPHIGTPMSDDGAMFLAWAVALRGSGHVSPNPLVGAVVLDRNAGFLSAGAHLRVGGAHAEVSALKRIENVDDFTGASLFVTLEPCAHEGRTPSCAKLLAKTKVARIVYGLKDPNPLVDGKGADILLNAGKVVQKLDRWESYCRWLCRVFVKNFERQKLFVGLKVASTREGVIAGHDSSRMWITGERARECGHFLRLEYDAILSGPRTVLLDNPTLNIRHPFLQGRTPLRIVFDPRGDVIAASDRLNIFRVEPEKTLLILPEHLAVNGPKLPAGTQCLFLPLSADGKFSWDELLRKLWDLQLRSLLIEGGAGIYQSALNAEIVDAIHWFVGSSGPQDGLTWQIPDKLKKAAETSCGVSLGADKLIEWSLLTGGCL